MSCTSRKFSHDTFRFYIQSWKNSQTLEEVGLLRGVENQLTTSWKRRRQKSYHDFKNIDGFIDMCKDVFVNSEEIFE